MFSVDDKVIFHDITADILLRRLRRLLQSCFAGALSHNVKPKINSSAEMNPLATPVDSPSGCHSVNKSAPLLSEARAMRLVTQ
jgi:hypothetical protein